MKTKLTNKQISSARTLVGREFLQFKNLKYLGSKFCNDGRAYYKKYWLDQNTNTIYATINIR